MPYLSLFFTNPFLLIALLLVFLFALSFHEYAHAQMAAWLGDHTAERMNRLTLNPFAHIDPLGFLALLFVGFGWAKPVPYNPYNLRFQKWGPVLVAAAGPCANLLLGFVSGVLSGYFFLTLGPENLLTIFLTQLSLLNFGLMLFNLIPLPPLDGSKALLAFLSGPAHASARARLESQGPMLLLLLILLDSFLPIHLFGWLSFGAHTLSRFAVSLFFG